MPGKISRFRIACEVLEALGCSRTQQSSTAVFEYLLEQCGPELVMPAGTEVDAVLVGFGELRAELLRLSAREQRISIHDEVDLLFRELGEDPAVELERRLTAPLVVIAFEPAPRCN